MRFSYRLSLPALWQYAGEQACLLLLFLNRLGFRLWFWLRLWFGLRFWLRLRHWLRPWLWLCFRARFRFGSRFRFGNRFRLRLRFRSGNRLWFRFWLRNKLRHTRHFRRQFFRLFFLLAGEPAYDILQRLLKNPEHGSSGSLVFVDDCAHLILKLAAAPVKRHDAVEDLSMISLERLKARVENLLC